MNKMKHILAVLLIMLFITPAVGAWSYPTGSGQSIRVTQPYMNYFPTMNGYHIGVDLGTVWFDPIADNIRAVSSGEVLFAQDGYNQGWGTTVILRHTLGPGNYLFSSYSHMVHGSLNVKKGDIIAEGDSIGLMGDTGNTTGKHLHFMIFARAYHDDPWDDITLGDLGYGYTPSEKGKSFVWLNTRFYDPLDILESLKTREEEAPQRGNS